MSDISRLHLLVQQMHLEQAEDSECPQLTSKKQNGIYVSKAVLPNGKHISLLKTLLTSVCERNCYYCPFRSGRDLRRASFKPDEFAKVFMYLYRINKIEGIFLSSGIVNGGISSQDKLIDTAVILRKKYDYQGYLHLKIMPGAEYDQVEQAMLYADRISINLEAPNTDRLVKLSPNKHFITELLTPIRWAQEIRRDKEPDRAWKRKWPSTVTQFVVGGAGESDLEILSTTDKLHKQMGLTRAYFSKFNPIPDTPLENHPPTPLIRQNRLYQASYLLRDYEFNLEELPFLENGDLPLNMDPKLAWAIAHINDFDLIEVNNAPRKHLLKVPGFGPKSADIILKARKVNKIRDLSELTKLGIKVKKAAPYILLDGRSPAKQARLF